ncbi:uncharacterized protein AAES06_000043 isoform 2-T2 [Glossophaga mutica]
MIGRVLCPKPSHRAQRMRVSPGRPRPCVPAAAAAAAAEGGGEGERRQREHCYSGTKMLSAGTTGAGERNPPPAAPCWKRAAPRPAPPSRAEAEGSETGGESSGHLSERCISRSGIAESCGMKKKKQWNQFQQKQQFNRYSWSAYYVPACKARICYLIELSCASQKSLE